MGARHSLFATVLHLRLRWLFQPADKVHICKIPVAGTRCFSLADETVFERAPSTWKRIPAIIRNQGWRRFASQSSRYFCSRAFGRARATFAIPEFERQAKEITDIEDALDFAYSFRSWRIRIDPFQDRQEIGTLIHKVSETKPKQVLEIGTGWGGTLFLLCMASSPDAVICSVDLPPTLIGRGYPEWRERLYRSFSRGNQRIEIVRGDSHDSATAALVESLMEGAPLDLLFIDGDHSYEGAKADFMLYSPMVRHGGLIVLHDVVRNNLNPEIKVFKFWREIRDEYKTDEISADGGRYGIGLVYV